MIDAHGIYEYIKKYASLEDKVFCDLISAPVLTKALRIICHSWQKLLPVSLTFMEMKLNHNFRISLI